MSTEQQQMAVSHTMTNLEELDGRPVPFKKVTGSSPRKVFFRSLSSRIATGRQEYEGEPDEILVHLYLYDYDENKIGRVSHALDGPRTFEPCLSASDWKGSKSRVSLSASTNSIRRRKRQARLRHAGQGFAGPSVRPAATQAEGTGCRSHDPEPERFQSGSGNPREASGS